MYLPTLDLSEIDIEQQWEKVKEEFHEVRKEFCVGSNEDLLAECLDLIQATKGLIEKIATPDEIESAFERHEQKLEGRQHRIIGEWRIQILVEANTNDKNNPRALPEGL